MLARWSSFAVGLGLLLSPLVLGYGDAAAVLRDVAMGALVCVVALAAVEWPLARLALAAPAAWLLAAGRAGGDRHAAATELVAGGLLLVLAFVPRPRPAGLPRVARRGAGARA